VFRWPLYSEWIVKGRLVSPGKPTNEKASYGVKLGEKHFPFLCVQWRLHYDFIFRGWLAGWLGGLHIHSGF